MPTEGSDKNRDHLKVLSIFHYIAGGLSLFFASFFIIHIVIGIITLLHPEKIVNQPGAFLPFPLFGWIFLATGIFLTLSGWTLGILLFLAGHFLVRAKHYLFCFLVAVLSCLFVPFGTILGIFTILLLSKNSVKEIFKPTVNKGGKDAKK